MAFDEGLAERVRKRLAGRKGLAEPHTRVFDLSGRPMKGWILVEAAGVADEPALAKWLRLRAPRKRV